MKKKQHSILDKYVSDKDANVYYPKQSQAYIDAVNKQDWKAAFMLYLPPVYKTFEQIQSEHKMKMLHDKLQSDLDRIKGMSNEDLKIDTEMRLKYGRKGKYIPPGSSLVFTDPDKGKYWFNQEEDKEDDVRKEYNSEAEYWFMVKSPYVTSEFLESDDGKSLGLQLDKLFEMMEDYSTYREKTKNEIHN